SMSLASAQRLLWAVDNGRSFSPAQVRPHELLNYFSFDTAPVAAHEMFSVLGGAEQTGDDTLSVALAVRGAVPPRKPLNLTVLIDRSGSMSAEGRMDYVKKGLRVMSDQLKPGDRVDVVLFDDRVCTPLENYVVGRDDSRLLADTIEGMRPRGSTNLSRGLKEAYGLATARTEGIRRNTRVMVITDAFLNTGDVNEDSVSQIGSAYEDQGIRLTGVGVGRDFNDKVLDMLTEKGKGAYVYLGSERVVERVFGPGFESLTRTIAHDVHFALDLPESLAMERFYGEEASTTKEDVQPIHYYAGTSQVFLQDLKMRKLKPSDPITLTISFREASTGEPGEQVWNTTVGALLEGDKRSLRKARALMAWSEMLLARSMNADPCGAELAAYSQRASLLGDDVEIAYVNGLVGKMCRVEIPIAPPPAPASTATLKVKVDSDIAISGVDVECGDWKASEALTGSDNVARFNAPVGSCTIKLQGVVEMRAPVEVPRSGKSIRCLVRGGRLSCS
ncbi:MAG: VWA domain-containing protein, partial [Deltaproteobacteria bacterium]|nr:VWA domain-containing protein [Deltaproteobacteria bacterium]